MSLTASRSNASATASPMTGMTSAGSLASCSQSSAATADFRAGFRIICKNGEQMGIMALYYPPNARDSPARHHSTKEFSTQIISVSLLIWPVVFATGIVLCDVLKLRPSVNHTRAHGGALRIERLFSCSCVGRRKPQYITE